LSSPALGAAMNGRAPLGGVTGAVAVGAALIIAGVSLIARL